MVELVARRLEADACSLYLTEPDLGRLTLRASKGLDPEAVDRAGLGLGEGLVGLVGQTREPIACERAREHPAFRYLPGTGEERFESLMAAPLLVRDVAIGVIAVQTERPRRFAPSDVQQLQTCAQLIAPVVLNAILLYMVGRSDAQRHRFVAELAHAGLPVAGFERPSREERNVRLHGIPTSAGIAIGPLRRLEEGEPSAETEYVPRADADEEVESLRVALAEARRDLDAAREESGGRFGPEFAAVFNTHIQILEDSGFVARLETAVQETGNAVTAVGRVVEEYRQLFDRIEDPYFRERGIDVNDVGARILAKLTGVESPRAPIEPGAVLVTSAILPAHFTLPDMEKVAAIVSEHGGATSHGAIFARTLEIPAVTGVPGVLAMARPGETAVVDGASGLVLLSPDEHLLAEYRRTQQRYEIVVEHLDALRHRPAETRDGRCIALTANVGLLADLHLVERHGAEGIGLFRTELLALAHRGIPEEEEQEKLYERAARAMAPRNVTIRTLDLGGDKAIPDLGFGEEDNPQLGWRSIRFALAHEDSFRSQLRAILRASAGGNVSLLLPMIASLEELRQAKRLVDETKQELARREIAFDPQIPVGVMIEVPAAALIAESLGRECDFFSIGTNDLTQYTLAVDRGNERVAHLFDPLHPGVLALIDRSVRAANRIGIPVSVCGEMATNPLAVPLLVGLGIAELSGIPAAVPVVKEIVRGLDASETAEDARRALAVGTVREVRAIAAARLREAGLLEHPDIGDWLGSILARYELS